MNYRKNFSVKSKPVQFQQERHTKMPNTWWHRFWKKFPIPSDIVFDADCTQVLLTRALVFFLFIWHILLKTTAFQSIKGTVIQIKKSLINDCLCVSKVSWKFRILIFYSYRSNLPVKFAIFLKSRPLFNSFHCLFSLWTRHCRS